MQLFKLIVSALITGSLTTAASASTTYFFDQVIPTGGEGGSSGGAITITGPITVNQLGTLDVSNITDYSLTFTGSVYPGPTVLTPSNSDLEVSGLALTATPTELIFDLVEDATDDLFRIRGNVDVANDFVRFSIQNDGEGSQVFALNTPNYAPPFDDPQEAGAFSPAVPSQYTLAVIPEPTTAALLALGGLAMLRRRRLTN